MGEKDPRDMINKATWMLVEVMKDAVSSNLTAALRTKQLDVRGDQVERLVSLVTASIEEGYHRGIKSFNKTFEAAIAVAPDVLAREVATRAKKKPG